MSPGILARMPAVGFKSTTGPEWGPCGYFHWITRWFITNSKGPEIKPLEQKSESWIIQHVKSKYKKVECGENCDGKVLYDLNEDYYEAWRIGKNGYTLHKYKYDFKGDGNEIEVDYSHIADEVGDDNWEQELMEDDTKGDNGKCGEWSTDTELYAVASIKAGELLPESVPAAGQAPASLKAPSNLGEPTLSRHAEGKWKCCGDQKTKTGSAWAKNKWNTYSETWNADGSHEKTVDGKKIQ